MCLRIWGWLLVGAQLGSSVGLSAPEENRLRVASGRGYDLKTCASVPDVTSCAVGFVLEQYRQVTPSQDKEVWVTEYWSPEKKELFARDTVELKGNRLFRYQMEQNRVERVSFMQRIESEDGNRFQLSRIEGEEKTLKEKRLKGVLVPPPLLVREVESGWGRLADGKSVEVELAIASDMTTYGVRLKRSKDGKRIELHARSFVVGWFMPEIFFRVADNKIVEWQGRVPVMRKTKKDFEDMDAFVLLQEPYVLHVKK